jgi:hypothetical protein
MSSDNAKRDDSEVPTLLAITDDSNQFIKNLLVDPATGRLLVSATGGSLGTVTSVATGVGLTGGTITTTGTIALATALQPMASLTGNSLKFLRVNAGETAVEYATVAAGSGTVTSVSVATANGFSGTVANATTTPAITIIAGAITPTSVNSVVISGSATPTLAVTGTSSISGSNTGDNSANSTYTIGSQTQAYNANLTAINQALTTTSSPSFTTVTAALSGNATTATNLSGTPTLPNGTAATTQSAFDGSTKLATTAYVDNAILSFASKPDVAYASTVALPANTYANGTLGVGATLTGSANGPLIIDGVTILVGQVGERVLVTGEAAPANNGWYTITQQGVVAVSPYILTRATESDQAAEIGAGYQTGVVAPNTVTPGSANNGKVFISIAADPFTVGTTNLTFAQVGGTYSAGNGIGLSGSTFSIDTSITVDKTTAQTLTNKTLTTPVLTGLPTGTGVATANTVSTLVARDGSGNFSAGTITAALTGTASGNLIGSNVMYIGTTSHALNRGSAAEGLAGITSLTPGADFTLSQNSVNVFTSENTGGIVNTLYLKAGNVGIGTTNPSHLLTISHVGADTAALQIGDVTTPASNTGIYLRSTTLALISTGNGGDIQLNPGSAGVIGTGNGMRLLSTGNVGIGTTSPATRLHIQGAGVSAPLLQLTTTGTGNREFRYVITGGGANYDTLYTQANTASGGTTFADVMSINAGGNVGIGYDASLATGKLVINGNVGIGTTGPGYKLDVNGIINSNNAIQAYGAESNSILASTTGVIFLNTYNGIRQDTSHNLNFDVYNGGSQKSAMTIIQNGNVGIGTTGPLVKLSVLGANGAESGTATPNGSISIGDTVANSQFLTMGVLNGAGNHAWIQSRNSSTTNTYALALNPTGGNVGIGTTGPNAKTEILATTEQLRLSYDATHFSSFTVNSAGDLTLVGGTTAKLTATTMVATTVNATTGVQINGAATSGTILKGNGTNFVQSTETYAAPGTSGNVLTSDGTNWTSAAAAGGTGVYAQLYTGALGGAAATFTTSSFAAKKHLKVVIFTPGGSSDPICMQFNSDNGSNYGSKSFYNSGLTSAAATYYRIDQTSSAGSYLANVDIYNVLANNKPITSISAYGTDNSGTAINNYAGGGWNNTSAQITTITLLRVNGGNLPTGTEVTVYGTN